MYAWFHTAILATSFAATIAVGLASAAILTGGDHGAAAKADRLPFIAAAAYTTIETRGDGVSVLESVPLRGTH